MRTIIITSSCVASLLTAAACNADPKYIAPAESLEVGAPGSDITVAETQILLPIRLEEELEAEERAMREAELGIMIPFVRRSDLDISLEWTIRNLDPDGEAQARIHINGANEYFAYVPLAFVVDPEEEETPPPLAGDIPILIEAGATISGVFREDDLLEAALDLELITRGGLNPFAAMLEVHEELLAVDDQMGTVLPLEETAQLIRLDVSLIGNRHLVMEYAVRVRDHRSPGLVHEMGLAADPAELTVFAPADFTPPPPDA